MWPHSWTSSLQNGVAWEWGQPTHIHLQALEIHTYTCYLYKYELMLHSFTGERAGNAGEQLLVRSDQHMHSHMLPPSHYTHTHVHHAYAHTHRRIKMQHQRLAQEMHEIAVAGLIQRKPKMKASRSLPAIIMKQPPRARVSSSLVSGSLFESKTSWASVASHAWMGEGPRKTLCYHFNWMQTPNHKN